MIAPFRRLWVDEKQQDIAEYAVMLAVILVLYRGHHTTRWLERQRLLFSGEFHSIRAREAA